MRIARRYRVWFKLFHSRLVLPDIHSFILRTKQCSNPELLSLTCDLYSIYAVFFVLKDFKASQMQVTLEENYIFINNDF